MELLDIYNTIKNPIDDPDIINTLIDIYGDNSTLATNFYDKIVDQHKSGKVIGKCYPELQRKFTLGIFNKWKKEVLSMTRDEFIELLNRGSYPKEFVDLRNYLKTMPEVNTVEELNHLKYGHDVPNNIKDLFEDYSWDSIGWGSGWTHVSSRHIYAKKKEQMPIEHRLYLNVNSTAVHRIAMEFISKCEEMDMPYYFKFNLMANRDDVIVIYSDTKHLTMFVDILNKIKEENPDLEGAFHEPPMLTGKIYDWLGYGTEPKEEKTSFNKKRSEAIAAGIDKTSKQWIKDHIIRMINFRGSFVHFYEYITVAMVETKLAELKSTYRYYDDCSKRDKNGYDPNYAYTKLGLKLIDLESIEFKDHLYKKLITNMEDRIISFCEDPNYKFKIELPVRDGNTLIFNQYDMDKAIKRIIPKIKTNDDQFVEAVRENILEESKKAGIDKNNFCFDTEMVFNLIKENNNSVKKEIPTKTKPIVDLSSIKEKPVEPYKVVSKRDMVVHTSYVPSHKLIEELHDMVDNHFDDVLDYLYKNMSSIRTLLPELMKIAPRLATIFVDDAYIRYPEVQRIYEEATESRTLK